MYAYAGGGPVNFTDIRGLDGIGIAISGNGEAGVGFYGGGATAGGGAGLFLDDKTGALRGGAFSDFGGFFGSPSSGPAYPSSGAHAVGGGAAGAGVGFFCTNANSVSDLGGYFDNFSINTPFFSAQYATGGGIWSFSLTFGFGAGISGSGYPTNTWTWP